MTTDRRPGLSAEQIAGMTADQLRAARDAIVSDVQAIQAALTMPAREKDDANRWRYFCKVCWNKIRERP